MYINFIDLSNAQLLSLFTTVITACITLTTLFFTVRNNKSNIYNNSVNKERIESMKILKMNVAEFNSHIISIINNEPEKETKSLIKTKYLIEFQLNSSSTYENELINKINNIIWLVIKLESGKVFKKEELNLQLTSKNISLASNLIFLNSNQYLISVLKLEFLTFQESISKHIKVEWEKIKKDSKI